MSEHIEYTAKALFAAPASTMPRVFGSPGRYVQGAGVIDHAGHYLSRLGFHRAAVLRTERCAKAEGGRLLDSMREANLQIIERGFGGECSIKEISGHCNAVSKEGLDGLDGLVVIGGGKVVDAGRAIAQRLGIPVAVVPSLASNDAPCAAVSVIYTPEGVTEDAEIYDQNPALVLVDTAVVTAADPRYLVAGMGDAMATWYEARACVANPDGVTVFGGRPTIAATHLAKLCADTLYDQGAIALQAVRAGEINQVVENIVEANTLLSGLGYESGGLAVSHAIAQGFTLLDHVHSNYMHGEMVAMGVLAQLAFEDDGQELARAAAFFADIGLPVRLEQLGLSADNEQAVAAIVQGAMAFPFVQNMTGGVTDEALLSAILAADQHGQSLH